MAVCASQLKLISVLASITHLCTIFSMEVAVAASVMLVLLLLVACSRLLMMVLFLDCAATAEKASRSERDLVDTFA